MNSVLLVDDHKHLVESLMTVIPWGELGFDRVFGAYSGLEALHTLRAEPIDLLVTDIRMPGMNGLELIECARQEKRGIRCVLLTGYAEFEYARRAIELQTFRYLMKPVRAEELIACVRALTEEAQGAGAGASSAPEGGAREQSEAPERKPHQQRTLEAVREYVRRNIGKDVTLQAIAEAVHLHPVYLSQFYKEATGTNLSEYILTARMERAKELLAHSTLRIYEVGEAVGYRSAQHFISEFKKAVGVTPNAYRHE